MNNVICSTCRNGLGTGSKKCFACEHYPELLKLQNVDLCPMCKGKTVWFEGHGDNTLVYICPKVSNSKYHHKSDETIKFEIEERQKEMLASGISLN